ncbi:MAG: succinate dehydrogenase/fumarate reductase iron-sulfur subunit [Clostridia bacterium]|nr:succinate dehydrogenase/fumarate reductase iron-sulfur subunit [Deltaproteobacteria bacterium]
MKISLNVWRQKSPKEGGKLVKYELGHVSPDMSFLEMIDVLNEDLVGKGEEPIAFEHDCREGICGSCAMMIDGMPHGPQDLTTSCQLHMRTFKDGSEITVEPWRARAFPVVKDLVVDRSAFDRIIQAGGYVSVNTGNAQDGNATPISKEAADKAFEAAACIACGACVAACPNASAMLFVSAKVAQLALLPQGQPERYSRAKKMVDQQDKEGFGSCRNHYECEAACPKGISVRNIAQLNRDYFKASVAVPEHVGRGDG